MSKLSGWMRVLAVASTVWVITMLIRIDPWYTFGRGYRVRRGDAPYVGHSNWDDFFLFGVLPIVIL